MDPGMSVIKGPGLYEFLVEAELQHYYNSIKSDLKVQTASQLKYVTDEDLGQLGMSKPEQRRLKKFYNKHFPQNYLSKFKRLLSVKKDDGLLHSSGNININLSGSTDLSVGTERSQGPRVPSKHIISSDSITVNKELGMGEFGVVQQGVWTNDGERIQVAIKCLARERMQNNPIEFLKEAAIMHSIDHSHIVRLYGVVLDTDSLMLVTELAPLRSLLECLKEPSLRSSFPVLTLCDFAMQVCDGMQYLEAKRLIHRDLAARNILVFSKNKVKISDFGLSRALGQGKDYYQTNFNVNLKLPIAWCAPECISYLRFTSASDVWAYGVTLWEMFSYGFQPWAALTGHQILEAIDEPNYQRLEQPDCCPQDHYAVMKDCWKHDPVQRPRFSELATRLADCRPEQVQAKISNNDSPQLLPHRVGDVITVLDKSHDNLWKGVLQNGKTGLFNPAHVVAYLGNNLPSGSARPESFMRNDIKTSSRRKLRTEMISSPQGDLKHTGHVGLDGAYFGDISFLGGSKVDYSSVPRQIVPPYKPQDDLEQAPLLCSGNEHLPLHASDHINLPHTLHTTDRRSSKVRWQGDSSTPIADHEYHEISDEENLVSESPRFETLDFGPSLMDEMESMFRNLNSPVPGPHTIAADHEGANKCNELRELSSRLASGKHRKQATVKPISAADQKTLDSAIALANEITARSMNDLDTEPTPTTPVSPTKRKFSFRFPSAGYHEHDSKTERRNFSDEAQSIPDLQKLRSSLTSLEDSPSNTLRLPLWDKASAEFCFAKSRELLTKPFPTDHANPSKHHRIHGQCHGASAPHNSCRDINQSTQNLPNVISNHYANQKMLEKKLLNLTLDDARRYYVPHYRDRTLIKSDSMQRKVYTSGCIMSPDLQKAFPSRMKLERNHSFLHDTAKYMCSPITSPPYWQTDQGYKPNNINYGSNYSKPIHPYSQNAKKFPNHNNFGYESAFVPVNYVPEKYAYENGVNFDNDIFNPSVIIDESIPVDIRPRALSFTETRTEFPKKSGKTVRDRNLRRQSYNPHVYESSSSDSECTSLGSAVHSDLELRRRRRTSSSAASRLSTSNSSIRSELIGQGKFKNIRMKPNQFLRPDITAPLKMGKSPPPSQSALSGLSPTTAARWQHASNTSSDSSL